MRPSSGTEHGSSHIHGEPFHAQRRKFIVATGVAGLAVLILFLSNLVYLFGSTYQQSSRNQAFHMLMVDYDGGIIGESMLRAYQQLKAQSFPTFLVQPTNQYPSPDAILQAVRNREYWGAIYTMRGASDRLSSALQGGKAATTYNANNALTYVWNEVRYPASSDSVLESSFMELVAATRIAYNMMNGTNAIRSLAQKDNAAVQAFLNPIAAVDINIQPVMQGSKVFYNTITMAMPVIQQFFFILALNGISARFMLNQKLSVKTSGLVRLVVSIIYTLFSALITTGYVWAFREEWAINGKQFVLTWILFWLLMHVHFCIISFWTSFLSPPAMPFIILTWIFLNITSSYVPFEISPGFYRWGYALPSNEVYQILIEIWSGGPAPQLYRALPILFSWWVVGLVLATIGHRHTCRLGTEVSFGVKNSFNDDEKTSIAPQDVVNDESKETGVLGDVVPSQKGPNAN